MMRAWFGSNLVVLALASVVACSSSTMRTDVDSGSIVDVGTDASRAIDANVDAGPVCGDATQGSCTAGLMCLGCPNGPIMEHYLCTTQCTVDTDCTDAARPTCSVNHFGGTPTGLCIPATGFGCAWGAVCASPDTMIATPSGERPIADLVAGDLVYSEDGNGLVAVPLLAVAQTPVFDHRVVRVTLATGRVLEISPGHPTADGRWFADLRPGDRLDGVLITSAELVPYLYGFTYDVLPASDTGTYVAGGALIGSTLSE